MDDSRVFGVICITLVLVIALNVGIYLAFSKRKPDSFTSTFGKTARELRNPWQEQDASMTELSNLVADLRNNAPRPDSDGAHQDQQEHHG
ncbi:MAG TPA: hypothetical protein VN363_08960 [Anaerolineales bacterium]|nr:hypothetical protein [Anaerolineales bacterium]